ncbi:MAG TPA: MBL fold metallo-hydrolase [Methylophilus sp.]|nr:MBL fold metallo-hydrolase [Methylophilus sp.]HQQ34236.1 MBL fold metallo-hydrolase [Methylophilus sp.]
MFKQLFEPVSSTLTYLIVDDETHEAALIDPVDTQLEVYLQLLQELNCKLKYSLETHVHADHITAGGMLRQRLGVETAVGAACGAKSADVQLKHGDVIYLGKQAIHTIATPGHTPGSVSFLWDGRVFTGDALLINGCGRTDFQGGDAGKLYDSITNHLFTLPGETLVYPGHDYNGMRISSIAQERSTNSRLAGKTRDDFIELMANLNLPKPRMIDLAVPANRMCGVPEEPQQG